MTKAEILELAEFDIDQECGTWVIPIDDLNGELAVNSRKHLAAYNIEVTELLPVKAHIHQRLLPLIEALAESNEKLALCMGHLVNGTGGIFTYKDAKYALVEHAARMEKLK